MIAYVLPGFIALAGLAPLFPTIAQWLRPVGSADLGGLGPPIYAVLGATAAGLVISCFRWLLLDNGLHRWTGVRRPAWDDSQLDRVLGAFDYLVQNHFRFAENTGNTLLALVGAYAVNRAMGTLPFLGVVSDIGMAVVSLVLFLASRDALRNYYARTSRLIGSDTFLEIMPCSTATTTGAATKGSRVPSQRPSPDPNRK